MCVCVCARARACLRVFRKIHWHSIGANNWHDKSLLRHSLVIKDKVPGTLLDNAYNVIKNVYKSNIKISRQLDAWDKCLGLVHWEDPEGSGRERGGGGESSWGIHVNPWLIHVNVWQKPLQYCKAISLQLIKINVKKIYQGNNLFSCGYIAIIYYWGHK